MHLNMMMWEIQWRERERQSLLESLELDRPRTNSSYKNVYCALFVFVTVVVLFIAIPHGHFTRNPQNEGKFDLTNIEQNQSNGKLNAEIVEANEKITNLEQTIQKIIKNEEKFDAMITKMEMRLHTSETEIQELNKKIEELYKENGELYCIKPYSNRTLKISGSFAQKNNQLIEITKAIVFAHYINASVLYFEHELFTIIYKYFDVDRFPGCWNIKLHQGERVDIDIGAAQLFWESFDVPVIINKDLIFSQCPTRASTLLSKGLVVPKLDVRNDVKNFLNTRIPKNHLLIGIHVRTTDYFRNSRSHYVEGAEEKIKRVMYADKFLIEDILNQFNVTDRKNISLVVAHAPDDQRPSTLSLHNLTYFIEHPNWDVFGDLWLISFADILIYNPTSSASRTAVLWNEFNRKIDENPSLMWPPISYYKHYTTRKQIFCKKFRGWRY